MSFIVKFIQLYSSAETVKKATVENTAKYHHLVPSDVTAKPSLTLANTLMMVQN